MGADGRAAQPRWKAAAAAGVWLGIAGGVGWLATRPPADPPPAAGVTWVDAPPLVGRAGDPAALPDDCPVLGVTANGRHRAYPLAVLSTPRTHVVNDALGGRPVAVSYCDRTGCGRAFAGASGVAVAGWAEPAGGAAGTLLVRAGGGVYRQDTGAGYGGTAGELPYPTVTTERTTWGAWRAAHPDTDLSAGGTPAD